MDAAHNLTCAELALITNVLLDRGVTSFDYMFKQRNNCAEIWCKYCRDSMMRIFYKAKDILYCTYTQNSSILGEDEDRDVRNFRFMIPRADIILLLKSGSSMWPEFLEQHELLDREISLLLLRNRIFSDVMQKYITSAEIRAQLIHAASHYCGYTSIHNIFPEIYDEYTLQMVIANLSDKSISRAELIERYTLWGAEFQMFPHYLQDQYKDQFIQLFPLIVLKGYYDINAAMDSSDIAGRNNLLDLIDRTIMFSDDKLYFNNVSNWLCEIYARYYQFPEFVYAFDLLIVEKHTKYLAIILTDREIYDDTLQIWNRHNKLQLMISNLKYDPNIMTYIPHRERHNIGADNINAYIRVYFRGTECTVSDIYKVKYGIDMDDKTICESQSDIKNIIKSICSLIRLKMEPFNINKISFNHILALGRNKNTIKFLEYVDSNDMLKYILPAMHAEFIRGMSIISAISAPQDIVDLMRLYYINESADDADINHMLTLFKVQ
jgi:hypothetical protein